MITIASEESSSRVDTKSCEVDRLLTRPQAILQVSPRSPVMIREGIGLCTYHISFNPHNHSLRQALSSTFYIPGKRDPER